MNVGEVKRQQLIDAIEAGSISDPMTMAIISIGVSVGSTFLTRMLTPKAPPQQIGLMKGTLQLQNSEQGIFIPEIYGAGPIITITSGSTPTWASNVNTIPSSPGASAQIKKNGTAADQVWNAGAVHNAQVQAGQDAYISAVFDSSPNTFSASAIGFCVDTNPSSGAGVGGAPHLEFGVIVATNVTGQDQLGNNVVSRVFASVIDGVRQPDSGHWNDGDTFRVERRGNVYHLYHDFAEVTTNYPSSPSPAVYLAYAGWRQNYGITNCQTLIGDLGTPPSAGSGGCKIPGTVVWAVPPQKHSQMTTQIQGSGKHQTSTPVEQIYYTIDLRYNYCKGPVTLLREYGNADILIHQDPNLNAASGIYNPQAGAVEVVGWTNIVGVSLANGILTNTQATGWGTSGASSTQRIHGDGYIEFTVTETDKERMIGFGTSDPDQNYTSILYGWDLSDVGTVFRHEGATSNFPNYPVIANQTRLKIQRIGSQINYIIDDIVVYTTSGASTADFLVDTSFYTSGGTIGPVNVTTGKGIEVNDPTLPPDPVPVDNRGQVLGDGSLIQDSSSVGTGAIQQGGSNIAVYPGNMTQQQDPTEESEVDQRNGVNSTTAHRGIAGVVHSNLNLSRWDNLVPNFTAVWQHQTLTKLSDIYGHLVQRITDQFGNPLLVPSDFDFSGLASIQCRGMLIDGRRFSPAEILDNQEIQDSYNYFTTEGEGQIKAFINGSEPSVTIPEDKVGWTDGGNSPQDGIFSTVKVDLADETKLPRQIDLKYINPGNDWDPDAQSYTRKVTLGNTKEQLQVQITMNPDEAKNAVTRRMFRVYEAGDVISFQLSWEYMYLYPGYKITIPTNEGLTYVLRLVSISGGVGIRDCQGIFLEPAAFDHNKVGGHPIQYNPTQPLPSITILAVLDIPTFRDTDSGVFGMYFAGTPRNTTTQNWLGFSLFLKRGESFVKIAPLFTQPAVMGKIVSATGLYPEAEVVDIPFTVDPSTNIFSSPGHQLGNGFAITLENISGGSLPTPLNATSTYYVRDSVPGSTFTLAATLGGPIISIASTGTGTNVIHSGTIIVDLYGTKATLASVSKTDMLAGNNLCSIHNAVFAYSSAERVAGFPNRWQISIIQPWLLGTDEFIGEDFTGRMFVVLNDAVKFVSLLETDINENLTFRAVSLGQSLDDVPDLKVPYQGLGLRPAKVTDISATRHDNDWLNQFVGHPRPEENPPEYHVEVWTSTDRSNPLNRKRTLPIQMGTSHAVALIGTADGTDGVSKNNLYCPASPENESAISAETLVETFTRFDFNMRWIGPDGAMVIPISITEFISAAFNGALNRNATSGEDSTWRTNLTTAYTTSQSALIDQATTLVRGLFTSSEYTALGTANDIFVEDLYQSYLGRASDAAGKAYWLNDLATSSRSHLLDAFDAATETSERARVIEPPDIPRRSILAALQTRDSKDPVGGNYEPDLSLSPISIEWQTAGANSGRAHEIVRSYGNIVFRGITTESYTRHDVDPGFSPTRDGLDLGGRPGERYTIFLSGTEYRVYVNFQSNSGQKPLVIVPTIGGFPFPFRMAFKVRDETTGYMAIENVAAGGNLIPTTIYSERDQEADFGAVQDTLYLRIYQRSTISGLDGIYTDLVVTAT